MKKIFLLALLVFCPLSFVFADTKNSVNIYFFHSNTCSHCKAENQFLKSIEKQYDNVNVYRYEIHDEKNADKIKMLEDIYQISLESVPVTVIGDTIFYGFSDDVSKNEFLRAISYYSLYGYQDKLGYAFQVKTLPSYSYSKNTLSYSSYLKKMNVKILGILPIFTLDNSMNASILGVLSGINMIFLCSLVLFFFLVQKEKEHKNRLFLSIFYFFFSYLGNIYLIKQGIWYFLFIILFFFILIFYSLKKKKSVFYLANIGLILSLMVTLITKYYFSYTIDIFNHINNLYQFTGLDCLSYSIYYLFPLFLIYLILLCILCLINEKKRNRKINL